MARKSLCNVKPRALGLRASGSGSRVKLPGLYGIEKKKLQKKFRRYRVPPWRMEYVEARSIDPCWACPEVRSRPTSRQAPESPRRAFKPL